MAYVAFASAGGFAGVRTFNTEKTRTERRREERDAARTEQFRDIVEQNAFRRTLAPKHCRGLEPFEREWFEACDAAFCEAMRANPTVRPSAGALQDCNGAGGKR